MSTARKVKTRNWSVDKFAKAVTNRAKKAEVPAKAIKPAVIKKAYDDGLSVAAAAAALIKSKAA
jgi:hypothetical protein